ncbi:MAG: hypothetical protein QNJ49_04470 [Mastigocoleus sp. MO_167.B18]|nr:hypothetical protein [Mastigocoleus sp. MO_167.B18]
MTSATYLFACLLEFDFRTRGQKAFMEQLVGALTCSYAIPRACGDGRSERDVSQSLRRRRSV